MAAAANPIIAVVGGGKMGEAIVGGLIASESGIAQTLGAQNFIVADPGQERRDHLARTYGVACIEDGCGVEAADVVVLAVKPQVMMGVLADLSQNPVFSGGSAGPLFVSIAAGLPTAALEAALPAESRLVRVMPNTPLLVGRGATAVTRGAYASEEDLAFVRDLFACLGEAFVVDESQMDAVCAVSGSGPAYVAALIEAMSAGGQAEGLDAQTAERLALLTVLGTAELMVSTGQSAESTRIAVCSPGGTTLAALDAMEKGGFSASMQAGVAAAARRSKELAQC